MTAADFEPARADCSMAARSSATGFAAYGSQGYVAGAALGNAVGNSIRAQATFNDCMSAKGWRIATPDTLASIKNKKESLKSARETADACVTEIRNRPTYTPIAAVFDDPKTRHFTMAQLAMDRLLTPSEAQLYITYRDQVNVCYDKRQIEYEIASPEAASIVQQGRQAANGNVLLLVKRQQTLSSFFSNAERLNGEYVSRLKLVNL